MVVVVEHRLTGSGGGLSRVGGGRGEMVVEAAVVDEVAEGGFCRRRALVGGGWRLLVYAADLLMELLQHPVRVV